jgi:hypothetical protein
MNLTVWTNWIALANDTLTLLDGCDARWWSMGPPCHTFQMVIGESTGENLAIMLTHTQYLAGPLFWSNQKLKVTWQSQSSHNWMDWEFVLEDPLAGFRAVSKTFHWAKNLQSFDENSWALWHPFGGGSTQSS